MTQTTDPNRAWEPSCGAEVLTQSRRRLPFLMRFPGEIPSGQGPLLIFAVRGGFSPRSLINHLPSEKGDANTTPTTTADAITTPSIHQLAAISCATLNDDVFGEDRATAELERHMAAVCGHEAASFVVCCTMANQLALAALQGQRAAPRGVLADASAHVVNFEAGGLATLSGATVLPVRPANGVYLTLADVAAHAQVTSCEDGDEDGQGRAAGGGGGDDGGVPLTVCPTRVVSVENTAHGNVVPLGELCALKEWATNHGVLVHIDGARVWGYEHLSDEWMKKL
ncbi:hypothetical protein VTG60DRAFT_441 [Thermothelomyces hinnuleus]